MSMKSGVTGTGEREGIQSKSPSLEVDGVDSRVLGWFPDVPSSPPPSASGVVFPSTSSAPSTPRKSSAETRPVILSSSSAVTIRPSLARAPASTSTPFLIPSPSSAPMPTRNTTTSNPTSNFPYNSPPYPAVPKSVLKPSPQPAPKVQAKLKRPATADAKLNSPNPSALSSSHSTPFAGPAPPNTFSLSPSKPAPAPRRPTTAGGRFGAPVSSADFLHPIPPHVSSISNSNSGSGSGSGSGLGPLGLKKLSARWRRGHAMGKQLSEKEKQQKRAEEADRVFGGSHGIVGGPGVGLGLGVELVRTTSISSVESEGTRFDTLVSTRLNTVGTVHISAADRDVERAQHRMSASTRMSSSTTFSVAHTSEFDGPASPSATMLDAPAPAIPPRSPARGVPSPSGQSLASAATSIVGDEGEVQVEEHQAQRERGKSEGPSSNDNRPEYPKLIIGDGTGRASGETVQGSVSGLLEEYYSSPNRHPLSPESPQSPPFAEQRLDSEVQRKKQRRSSGSGSSNSQAGGGGVAGSPNGFLWASDMSSTPSSRSTALTAPSSVGTPSLQGSPSKTALSDFSPSSPLVSTSNDASGLAASVPMGVAESSSSSSLIRKRRPSGLQLSNSNEVRAETLDGIVGRSGSSSSSNALASPSLVVVPAAAAASGSGSPNAVNTPLTASSSGSGTSSTELPYLRREGINAPGASTAGRLAPPPPIEYEPSVSTSLITFDVARSMHLELSLPLSNSSSAPASSTGNSPRAPRVLPPRFVDDSNHLLFADTEAKDVEDARVRARVKSEAASYSSPYAIPLSPSVLALSIPSSTSPTRSANGVSFAGGGGSPSHSPGGSNTLKKKKSNIASIRTAGGRSRSGTMMSSMSSKKAAKLVAKLEEAAFKENDELTTADVYRAAQCEVIDVDGKKIKFGSLFEDQLTVVCFIRHFWCPLCQDYMQSIVDNAPKEALDRAGVRLIVIGNGSPHMAKAYKDNIFHSPYDIFVDPSRALYRAMGMTRATTDGGKEEEKGDYVQHGPIGGIGMVLKNALKMPLGNAGDIKQLGGEFLLGPGIRAEFCHRMPTTRSHTSIKHLLKLANVDVSLYSPARLSKSIVLPPRLDVEVDDEDIKKKKEAWDEFMQWTLDRRFGAGGLGALGDEEAYPYAFADRDLWMDSAGFCAPGDHHSMDDSCSISAASAMSHILRAVSPSVSEADRVRLDSWGLRRFFDKPPSLGAAAAEM